MDVVAFSSRATITWQLSTKTSTNTSSPMASDRPEQHDRSLGLTRGPCRAWRDARPGEA
jgi:hypothetical protein